MDTNVIGRINTVTDPIALLQAADWGSLARKLAPPIDERLLYYVFGSTLNCWLALALLLRTSKSSLKLSNGRKRKTSKIPSFMRFRYFTHAELESIYFLVLTELFTSDHQDKLDRLQNFVETTKSLSFKSDLRAVFMDLGHLFANEGGEGIQKKTYRARNFLLANGFSHIRLDFITGQIRLCPITKDFDPTASLYMRHQPQKDIVPPEVEQQWIDKFGPKDRGFYEIALDRRVNDFHKGSSSRSRKLTVKGMVAAKPPKYGIVALPLLSGLIAEEGFSAVLFDITSIQKPAEI